MKSNAKPISRRDFIKITAMAGSALLGGKMLLDLLDEGYITVKETRVLMGTIINLAVVAESKPAGEQAVAAAFAEFERLVAIFNHRNPVSPVAVLNRAGILDKPPAELVEVLDQAVEISRRSGGAFDVTVKPLLDLYQHTRPNLPDSQAVSQTLSFIGCEKMDISPERISFNGSGMSLTLDGIAKGYIVDNGTAKLKCLGYTNVFVEAGGDLMASGSKAAATPWRVGVQSPRAGKANILAKFDVTDQAVATSGDYMQFFTPDMKHHHILDPRIGLSPTELASVTVFSKSAMHSDALATAVMVLGGNAGMALIEASPDVEGLLITKDLKQIQSSGF